jgi:hypothetical protein
MTGMSEHIVSQSNFTTCATCGKPLLKEDATAYLTMTSV